MPRVKASLLQSSHENPDSQRGAAVTRTHLDKRAVANPSAGVLRGDMSESHCRPERIQDGIYTWWCHLETQNQGDRDEILPIRVDFPVFSHRFPIKVVEGNKPCTAGLSQDTHIYNRSNAPITLVNTYWDCGWNHREAAWTVVESISNLFNSWIHLGDGTETFPPPHSPISSSPSSISVSALGTSGGGWQTLNW